jgi:tetratricopeptide (TPR) repeat protein
MMHLETKHRQAFERFREAQLSLSLFQQSKERTELEKARKNLEEALTIDPKYLRAIYYRGLVRDMLGQPSEAAKDFRLVSDEKPPFLAEAKYNLGVATFHQYGSKKINDALKEFEDVIQSTRNPALRLRAGAFVAHSYALMMIPTPPDKTDCDKVNQFLASEAARQHVARYHRLSVDQSERMAAELKRPKGSTNEVTDVEVRWRLCNTRAVQRMFYTDYFADGRLEKLREGEKALLEADGLNPRNWSVYCNLGSTYMRLAHWSMERPPEARNVNEAEECFEKAIHYLDVVIAELLPNYGFALYEKGRVYRLWERFDEAEHWLRKAWEVEKDRAVSDETLKCELERAKLESTDYPFLRADRSPS